MTYQESLAWLYSTQQFGIKLGLENTIRLLDGCGNPHDGLRILHVAGTNGKGSVCAMLDAILRRAGHRTGLYTSPHLVDFRERIQVDGKWVSREFVAGNLTRLRKLCAECTHPPTFFEISTVLALEAFSEAACDVVVLETGMGGRLDATNAVTPIVSIITPIAMDHAEWLGNTIGRIAAEKAGIIKTGVPAVSAPQVPAASEVLRQKANSTASALTFVSEPWPGALALPGEHQTWNAALAVLALNAAGLRPADESVSGALAGVHWPGRFQRLSSKLVVDGAHNPHSARALVNTWKSVFGDEKAVVVFGALRDKDYREMLDILGEIAVEFLFVPIASARTARPDEFVECSTIPSRTFEDLPGALSETRGRLTLITGSLFLVGEVLALS